MKQLQSGMGWLESSTILCQWTVRRVDWKCRTWKCRTCEWLYY